MTERANGSTTLALVSEICYKGHINTGHTWFVRHRVSSALHTNGTVSKSAEDTKNTEGT